MTPDRMKEIHDCPACDGWKLDGHEYCSDCQRYRNDLIEKKAAEERNRRAEKRAIYFMDKV